MDSEPSSILEKLLPGAWPKWIFGTSIVLSAALYKLFPDLPSTWLHQTEPEKFLLRLLISGLCLLLGAIALIISLVVHINRKSKKDLNINTPETQQTLRNSHASDRSSAQQHKIEYFTVHDYKWKVVIYSNGTFDVEKYPICIKHDLRFWFDTFSKSYKCPERDKRNCDNEFSWLIHEKIYDTAKSYIEKEIRNNPDLIPNRPPSRRGIISRGVIE